MLSVGIPAYNSNVSELLSALADQASHLPEVLEIIVLDDASEAPILPEGFVAPKVRVLRHTFNQGRSKTRNHIASEAKSPWILFIDGDSGIHDGLFLRRWCDYLASTSASVVVGGSDYQTTRPSSDLFLRWHVSRMREQTGESFKTNNVAIQASVFNQISFNEALQGYGHEDTLFGFELQQKKIPVEKYGNPVLNKHLDSNEEFLRKTVTGIRNLLKAQSLSSHPDSFNQQIRMLRFYHRMKRCHSLFLIEFLDYLLFNTVRNRLLKGKKVGMVNAFDFFKLCTLHRLRKEA